MKKILTCEAMPELIWRHESNVLKTRILPLNSPGQHGSGDGFSWPYLHMQSALPSVLKSHLIIKGVINYRM